MEFLSARVVRGVEMFVEDRYVRTVSIGKHKGWIEVIPDPERCRVRVRISHSLAKTVLPTLNKVRRLYDLNAEPHSIVAHLGAVAAKDPGIRLPGAFDSFEMAVRAILGQQVSVKGATTLMARFVAAFGEPFETPYPEVGWIGPSASKVANLAPEVVAEEVHIPEARARAIVNLAKSVADGQLNLDHSVQIDKTLEQLVKLPGIGEWTAQYIAMRALNWPDAFPHGDLGIKKALDEDNAKAIIALAEKWRPWRAYAVMHLWKSLAG